jgi:hypothetical protein
MSAVVAWKSLVVRGPTSEDTISTLPVTASANVFLAEPLPFRPWRRPQVIDPEQAWFWTPEWQSGEAQVSVELAAGLGEVFDSVEDFLADLDN